MRKGAMIIGTLVTLLGFCIIPQALDGVYIGVRVVPVVITLLVGGLLIAFAVTRKKVRQDKEYFVSVAEIDTSWWDTYTLALRCQNAEDKENRAIDG